jgi:hypothetical protein
MSSIGRGIGRITIAMLGAACIAGSVGASEPGSAGRQREALGIGLALPQARPMAARRKKTGGQTRARRRAAAGGARRKPARPSRPRVVAVSLPGEELDDLREPDPTKAEGAVLTAGDLDADRERAASSGEEAVGGSASTPDQDQVDAIGQALGVERAQNAEVVASADMLKGRDQRRWRGERRTASEDNP